MSAASFYSDKELFTLIARGDEEAFALFFHKYKSPLFHYAFKVTKTTVAAEELVQELFLKLWAGRGALLQVQNPSAYIYRMAANAGIDYLRQLAGSRRLQQAVAVRMGPEDDTTQEVLVLSETRRLLLEAVKHLTPAQRQVFYLSREEGLSYEEIAEHLGIARNTVKNHLTASLKIIRHYLARHYHPVVVVVLTGFMDR